MKTTCRVLAVIASHLLLALPAQAQLFRAYLSQNGSDANACTLAAPCRLLPAALNAVAAGGQIWILDSANFNTSTVNVTKSVSISALPGQNGSLVATGGTPAMVVNAPGATVSLRNLVFTDNVLNHGTEGLKITSALSVSVENCQFVDLNLDSLVAINNSAFVHVADSTFRNVNGWSVASWNGPNINVTNARMQHTEGPFVFTTSAGTTSTMSITDSTISDGAEGIFVSSVVAGGVAKAFITRSTIYGTTRALDSESSVAGAITLITVSNSSVTKNQFGLYITGADASVKSLGNNYIADNAGDTGALTATPLR
jgi:hypothetical protein